jgi:hypothetical protein
MTSICHITLPRWRESRKRVVMSAGRRMLVVVVTMLSLVGVGGAVQSASADTAHTTSSTRWCC